ncbi:MAG TPA: LysM peptidoglycan-binding domain-containing protein [Candidatus Acidoferrum sp.]
MASPDLDAPARVSHLSADTSPSGSVRRCVPFILIFSFAFAGARQCRAQEQSQQGQGQSQTPDRYSSVAEAARQERARKQNQQKKTSHVYTAEDLNRERILTPEDRAEFEARKSQQTAAPAGSPKLEDGVSGPTVAQDAHSASPSANSAEVSLGDIARRSRREKESQQLQRSAEFPLPFSDAPLLASPRPSAQPLLPSVTVAPPPAVVATPRVIAPWRPFVKRSPFERPRVSPAPPAAPRRSAPRAPRLSPAPDTARLLTPPLAPVPVSPMISGKPTIVTVKPGDSLWKLAALHLGDGRRWRELLTLNPGLPNPDLLEAGSQIVVPASFAPPPALAKYTVRNGDTLWTIAQAQLGHGTAWAKASFMKAKYYSFPPPA